MGIDKGNDVSEARKLAVELLFNIFEKGAYANLILEKELAGNPLKSEDKNLVTEIVNGTTRMLKHLDWVINLFLTRDITKINPWLRTILRMTTYQIMFMDRIPDYACINDAVTITKQKTNKNLSGVTNGVLRNLVRKLSDLSYPEDKAQFLAVYFSHPEWIVNLMLDKYGFDTTEQILAFNNQSPQLVIRHNQLQGTRQELIEILEQQNVSCRINNKNPWAINIDHLGISLESTTAYRKGYFYVQNEGSMLAAAILNVLPGQTVYDLCSGVGGKTTHLAEMMQNQGKIKAYELYDKKIKLLQANCARLGIDIIHACQQDILELDESDQLAARVLLDAPCSGLGVLNRRSDMRWRQNPDNMEQLTKLQLELLIKAGQLVDRDGLLLYSTCTINNAENERIVEQFLQEKPNYQLESFSAAITYFGLDTNDANSADQGMLTIIPGKYETDGMFYALMRRKS